MLDLRRGEKRLHICNVYRTNKYKTMKTLVESIDTTEDAAVTPSVAVEASPDTTESSAPKKEISKMAIWARAHKGFIEVLDPELRSQMANFRARNKVEVYNATTAA